jgi:hypothetical protein
VGNLVARCKVDILVSAGLADRLPKVPVAVLVAVAAVAVKVMLPVIFIGEAVPQVTVKL